MIDCATKPIGDALYAGFPMMWPEGDQDRTMPWGYLTSMVFTRWVARADRVDDLAKAMGRWTGVECDLDSILARGAKHPDKPHLSVGFEWINLLSRPSTGRPSGT